MNGHGVRMPPLLIMGSIAVGLRRRSPAHHGAQQIIPRRRPAVAVPVHHDPGFATTLARALQTELALQLFDGTLPALPALPICGSDELWMSDPLPPVTALSIASSSAASRARRRASEFARSAACSFHCSPARAIRSGLIALLPPNVGNHVRYGRRAFHVHETTELTRADEARLVVIQHLPQSRELLLWQLGSADFEIFAHHLGQLVERDAATAVDIHILE